MRERLQIALAFLARQADNVLFVIALVMIGVGCAIERPALGLIVPGSIVLSLIVLAWVARSILSHNHRVGLGGHQVDHEDSEDRGA